MVQIVDLLPRLLHGQKDASAIYHRVHCSNIAETVCYLQRNDEDCSYRGFWQWTIRFVSLPKLAPPKWELTEPARLPGRCTKMTVEPSYKLTNNTELLHLGYHCHHCYWCLKCGPLKRTTALLRLQNNNNSYNIRICSAKTRIFWTNFS